MSSRQAQCSCGQLRVTCEGDPIRVSNRKQRSKPPPRKADLKALATRYMDPKQGIILIVRPRAKNLPQLAELGLAVPEFGTADGD